MLLFGISFIVFCLISLPNHYLLRTYALDLGMFNHAMYDFSHGRMNIFLLDLKEPHSYFADHFSPITILLSPFQYIFGTYTPLIIQALSVLIGGLGIFKYARLHGYTQIQSRLFVIYTFILWGVINALSFDFHTNVLAAMWLIWIFYFYEIKKYTLSIIISILVLICKENIGLWLAFVWSGYGLLNYKGPKQYIICFIIPSILYFTYSYLVIKQIMPSLSTGNNVQLDRYSHWGNSTSEIFSNFKNNPILLLELFFNLNENKTSIVWGPKAETWILFLISGGIVLFRKPIFIWMLVPIFAQKFLSSHLLIQGISYQYSIEFVPILLLGSIYILKTSSAKKRTFLISILILGALMGNAYNINPNTGGKFNTVNMAFYNSKHYKSYIDNLSEVKETWNSIPKNAIISVNSIPAPHLAMRDKIYHFPRIDDAEYIVLFTPAPYPFSQEDFELQIVKLKESEFEVWKEIPNLIIFKRN